MARPINRQESLEIQAGADALLTRGGGGVAVWVRRDELQPRVAARFSTAVKAGEEIGAEKIAVLLATLRIGVDRITQGLADTMDMPREVLEEMVGIAHKELRPHFEATTNIERSYPPKDGA